MYIWVLYMYIKPIKNITAHKKKIIMMQILVCSWLYSIISIILWYFDGILSCKRSHKISILTTLTFLGVTENPARLFSTRFIWAMACCICHVLLRISIAMPRKSPTKVASWSLTVCFLHWSNLNRSGRRSWYQKSE